jgi:hypothetical protein
VVNGKLHVANGKLLIAKWQVADGCQQVTGFSFSHFIDCRQRTSGSFSPSVR